MANGSDEGTKSTVKTIVGVVCSIGIIFTAGWVGWMSSTQVDQNQRLALVEQAQKVTDSLMIEFKTDISQSKSELIAIRTMLHEVRADQIRKMKKER